MKNIAIPHLKSKFETTVALFWKWLEYRNTLKKFEFHRIPKSPNTTYYIIHLEIKYIYHIIAQTIDGYCNTARPYVPLSKKCCNLPISLGGDATESFEDVGHSTDARVLMKDYLIGELIEVLLIPFIIFIFSFMCTKTLF